MRIVGLTGRSGSGKTSVCIAARDLGIEVMNCDLVYREMTSRPSPLLSAIGRSFGKVAVAGGSLNRSVLREIVFADRKALKRLNSLTARYMGKEIRKLADSVAEKTNILLLDAPTLFETGTDSYCDYVIGVIANEEDCISRLILRDGISEEEARIRLRNQLPESYFLEHCDVILENRGDMKELYDASVKVLSDLLNRS